VAPTPDIQDVRRLLVLLGRIGTALGDAIADEVGPELSANGPVVALFALEEQGPLRPGQLQDITGLSSGGVSKLLDRLEEGGLVTREYGVLADDKRGSVVRLTTKGRRTSRRMAGAIVGRVGELRVVVKEIEALLEPDA
jgi:DNA-binding MarR family transcriptional regulator